jgi:glycosyltransferase involved in cell wall biosynthesis
VSVQYKTLVSVIVPSFNQGRYIEETVSSIIAQDYRPIEIIVQDGGSTDETLNVLEQLSSPDIIVRSEQDSGVVEAVNKGLKAATGDVLTIMSSDDVFLAGSVSAAVQAFKDRPECLLIYGDIQHIDENSIIKGSDIQDGFDLASYLGRLVYIPQPGAFLPDAVWKRRTAGGSPSAT